MTQEERILNHFDNRSKYITSLEAFRDYGITRLASVIHRLRKKGHVIDSVDTRSENRYGEIVHFVKYIYQYKGVPE